MTIWEILNINITTDISVGGVRDRAEEILYYFNTVLKSNSPIQIKKAREVILPILHNLDEYVNRDVFEIETEL